MKLATISGSEHAYNYLFTAFFLTPMNFSLTQNHNTQVKNQ